MKKNSATNKGISRPTIFNGYFFWCAIFVLMAYLGVFNTLKDWISFEYAVAQKSATVETMSVSEEVPASEIQTVVTSNDAVAASTVEEVRCLPFLEEGQSFVCYIGDYAKVYGESNQDQEWLDEYVKIDDTYTDRRASTNGRCLMGHRDSSGMRYSKLADEITIVHNGKEYKFTCEYREAGTNEGTQILMCTPNGGIDVEKAIDNHNCDLAIYTCKDLGGYNVDISLWKLVD